MRMLDLSELMQAIKEVDPGNENLSDDVVLARLQEHVHLRNQDNPFKVGDLVKVRADAPIKKMSKFLLVAAIDNDAPFNPNDPGMFNSRQQDTVYAVALHQGIIAGFWMAHYHLEPFHPASEA